MSKWKEWKNSLGEARPWHLLDHSKLIEDETIVNKRLEICLSCDDLIKLTKQCRHCGCVMTLKTKVQNAACPIGKW